MILSDQADSESSSYLGLRTSRRLAPCLSEWLPERIAPSYLLPLSPARSWTKVGHLLSVSNVEIDLAEPGPVGDGTEHRPVVHRGDLDIIEPVAGSVVRGA